MLNSSRWLLILGICILETKQTLSIERHPRPFLDIQVIFNFATTPFRVNHDYYDYNPPSTQFFISNFLKKILGWKTKPYKPYYRPYKVSKPRRRMTTSAPDLECGIANPGRKIFGGDETGVNQYPWMVAVCSESPCNLESQVCAGTLVNKLYVLTSATCFEKIEADIFVSLGDHDLSTDAETSSIEMKAEEHIVFPGYSTNGYINNLALIKLPSGVTITDNIRPICLPKDATDTYSGVPATITGWGITSFEGLKSEVLMGVSVPVFSNADCGTQFYGIVLPTQICSGGMGKNPCSGDSGAPLITEIGDNKFELIGIASHGFGCNEAPIVYTRVTEYLDWIKETTEESIS